VLDQAAGELITAGRVVKELERGRSTGDAPEDTEMIGH